MNINDFKGPIIFHLQAKTYLILPESQTHKKMLKIKKHYEHHTQSHKVENNICESIPDLT